MKSQIFKTIFIALVAIVTFSACREEVILDLNTMGAIPVIEAKISTDSVPFRIRVTTTADYYSLEIPVVTTAFVTISGSDGSKDTLFHDTAGYYESKKINPCKVGVTYTILVNYNGQNYTASEICPAQNPIDSIYVVYKPKGLFVREGYYLYEHTREKPGKGDYYQWELYRNDTALFDNFYYLGDDQFLEESGQVLDADFFPTFQKGDSIVLEQMAISKQYYNYLTALQSQTNRDGSPFSAPPSNLTGNISNRGLGYFAVRNMIRKKLVVK